MDTLHPITPTEQLMAQGEYNYQVSGKDSGLTESWSLHRLPGQAIVHRAVVGGTIAGMQLKQVSHFMMTPNYRPTVLEMTQEFEEQTTHSTIRCFANSIEQTITTQDEVRTTALNVPTEHRLFFPPVSAQGFILAGYNFETGKRQAIPLVSVRIHPEDDLPLSVELQTIEYELVKNNEEIETPAGQFACHHYIRYDQHMEQQLWLDDSWMTIQWSVPYSPIMQWEYLLVRYQRGG